MKILILYFLILAVISIRDFFKVKDFDDFVVAGRKQSATFVFLSLMATVLGASSTVGIAAKTSTLGFAAFWWLGVGAIGFWFQAIFLSKRIHALNVRTLPELANVTVGSTGQKLVALVIAVSWIGVIAAQFLAIASFMTLVLGHNGGVISTVVTAAFVIIYTLLGGQLSVVRTDAVQFFILAFSFVLSFLYLFGGFVVENPLKEMQSFALLNENFGIQDLLLMLFTVGGAYFLGPDVISRNLIAKSPGAAKRGVIIAGFSTVLFGVIIVLIAMWQNTYATSSINPLFALSANVLPLPLSLLLSIGLLSALLSSADTCLINAAAIFSNDLLHTKKIYSVRILVAIIGTLAIIISLRGQDIIGLLTMAYSVYTPGIVAPLALAILAHKKFNISRPLWYTGVILGGLFGLIPALLQTAFKISTPAYMPHIGIAVSLLFSLFSLQKKALK